jgi:exonuclease SbcD
VFRVLKKITGDLTKIKNEMFDLKVSAPDAWVEIEYTGDELITSLRDLLEAEIKGTEINIQTIRDQRLKVPIIDRIDSSETLDELTENEVFDRCLKTNNIPVEQRGDLIEAYKEILSSMHESDINAE